MISCISLAQMQCLSAWILTILQPHPQLTFYISKNLMEIINL